VLIDSPVEVICQATKGTAPEAAAVAPSSVKIIMEPASGGAVSKDGAPVAGQADTYSASFPIQALPTGSVAITCTAADQLTPSHVNSATISTYIDHGPVISNVVPSSNAAFALKKTVHFEFKVTSQPVGDDDPGSAIGPVTLKVGDVTFNPSLDSRGYYTAEVNFGDATKFPQTPSGQIPVVISAANKREQPRPATATTSYYILLDGDPPTISITSPAAGRVIGGQQTLAFSVTDTLSGVDPQMVLVNLGANQSVGYPYKADDQLTWKLTRTVSSFDFAFTFDSAKFDKTDSQVSVSIVAADLAGNQSTSKVNLYYLDNQPPFVSLDPPSARIITPAPDKKYYCSKPFDPVGPRSPDNGEIVNSFEIYRAFAWDRTNGKPSQDFLYLAGVDPAKVQLFIQPDATKRIIYDRSGDGFCDSIDEDIRRMPAQPYLVAITDYGTPDFSENDYTVAPNVTDRLCTGQATNPTQLCKEQRSDMSVVMHQLTGGQSSNIAAIYAIQAVAGEQQCTGLDWDISDKVQEGWVCLAAEASDSVGNLGVSAPIAVCFDNEATPAKPSCATGLRHAISTEVPPKCITDGCLAPSRSLGGDYDSTSGSWVAYDIGHPTEFVVEYRQ
jgi:hypothetical protein